MAYQSHQVRDDQDNEEQTGQEGMKQVILIHPQQIFTWSTADLHPLHTTWWQISVLRVNGWMVCLLLVKVSSSTTEQKLWLTCTEHIARQPDKHKRRKITPTTGIFLYLIKATVRDYLLDESCVATWMVSNVHITIMNGMITWKGQFHFIYWSRDILFIEIMSVASQDELIITQVGQVKTY